MIVAVVVEALHCRLPAMVSLFHHVFFALCKDMEEKASSSLGRHVEQHTRFACCSRI